MGGRHCNRIKTKIRNKKGVWVTQLKCCRYIEDLQTQAGLARVKEWAREEGMDRDDVFISADVDEVSICDCRTKEPIDVKIIKQKWQRNDKKTNKYEGK